MAQHSVPPLVSQSILLLFVPLACAHYSIPATEFTYGSFTSDLKICYSSSINSQAISVKPVTRTFSFIPDVFDTVRYIQIMSPDLKKFYAQIVNGGIGTGILSSTDIAVSSVHGGLLNVAVRIFCSSPPVAKYDQNYEIFSPTFIKCYTETVYSTSNTNMPTDRSVSYTPPPGPLKIQHIKVVSFAQNFITSSLTDGGIGTGNPTITTVVVNSAEGIPFKSTVTFFCAP
ncbi:uncharacterized protein LOC120895614 [Anopheles arabiensis]|uniref:Uncharacterized protein n=1 Tax=Anopheles arabiensis TaxID=7173 RepID=A0A2C9GRF2_ANOAR|nr:uncharacterized protein LOC120895614 [Anopheles arabiensis]